MYSGAAPECYSLWVLEQQTDVFPSPFQRKIFWEVCGEHPLQVLGNVLDLAVYAPRLCI